MGQIKLGKNGKMNLRKNSKLTSEAMGNSKENNGAQPKMIKRKLGMRHTREAQEEHK